MITAKMIITGINWFRTEVTIIFPAYSLIFSDENISSALSYEHDTANLCIKIKLVVLIHLNVVHLLEGKRKYCSKTQQKTKSTLHYFHFYLVLINLYKWIFAE